MTKREHRQQADAFLGWWGKQEAYALPSMAAFFDMWCDSKDFEHRDRVAIWILTDIAPSFDGPPELGWQGVEVVS